MSTTAEPDASVLPSSRPSAVSRYDWAMLLVALVWGANFAVMKSALGALPPLAFSALRFAIATVLLWAIVGWREGRQSLPPRSVWPLVWLGVVGNTLYQLGFILGLDRSTATNTALIIAAVPAVVAVLGGLLGLERTTARQRWGIGLGIAGVALVVLATGVPTFGARTAGGDLFTFGAMLCWSAYTLGLRTVPPGLSPLRVTAWTMLAGTPGLVLVGLPELVRLDWSRVPPAAWAGLGYASACSLVLAYILFNTSVRAIGGNRTAIYMCVSPLCAALVAWLLLGEHLTGLQIAGGVAVLAGVLLTREPVAPEG
jgi:drug/metabolite transporter (DMT)-like permease